MNYRKIYCKDCNKLLNKGAYYIGTKRCNACNRKGKKLSLKHKKNISVALKKIYKNYHHMFGKKHSIKTKIKISESLKKLLKDQKNHPNWQGGISFEPYDPRFNEAYKETIRFRDHCKCQLCGCHQIENGRKLDVHHIDYNKMNTVPKNNISLCKKCSGKVNFNRKYWTKYFKKVVTQPDEWRHLKIMPSVASGFGGDCYV